MKEYTDVFVLGNKIIGKDKRTGHYVKIVESEKDDTDIENYDDIAANRSKEKVTVQKEANKQMNLNHFCDPDRDDFPEAWDFYLSVKLLKQLNMRIPSSEESRTRTSSIIMVDNEPDVNITIKTALEENGDFRVDTFNDAESVLFAFKPGHYDLAILDVRMQGMNGFQLCRKLREIDKKLKICFLTASDLTSLQNIDSDIINDLGTDCFVTKPVNTSDLANRLKVILSQE